MTPSCGYMHGLHPTVAVVYSTLMFISAVFNCSQLLVLMTSNPVALVLFCRRLSSLLSLTPSQLLVLVTSNPVAHLSDRYGLQLQLFFFSTAFVLYLSAAFKYLCLGLVCSIWSLVLELLPYDSHMTFTGTCVPHVLLRLVHGLHPTLDVTFTGTCVPSDLPRLLHCLHPTSAVVYSTLMFIDGHLCCPQLPCVLTSSRALWCIHLMGTDYNSNFFFYCLLVCSFKDLSLVLYMESAV